MKIYLKNNDENLKNVYINFTIFKTKIRKFFDVFDEKQTTKKNNLIFNIKNIDNKIRNNILKKNEFN